MNTKDLRKAKLDLEKQIWTSITDQISEFEEKTSIKIAKVEVDDFHHSTIGGPLPHAFSINVFLDL